MDNKSKLVETSKKYFAGLDGYKKSNCAQAVANTFTEELHIRDINPEKFIQYGGGRAPNGECGAMYAAKVFLEATGKADKIDDLKEHFVKNAGSIYCKEIRAAKKLPCAGCVAKGTEFLCDAVCED
ncbi:C-GCAxxG-C-C family (seleno)protein [Ethanoligenens harbinense]|uniref:C_GCAxxG_C_C family protein n=1 Tax=Ethanoligenens harbinense (strain DSM 18485 / JCM 12961 / CGMCC 1.5033 / YUAN-3) TaxID=663278 RepID=E6U9S0_ETHHY|nr:C-GCAxxG-C-C family (seleno)protein [Ethanoligenens harbinense]ADU26186.1 hypothetical protein Ethha_0612 [Ethanoligenens harbinense YUAN-3]AVQ95324.1 hypothetical protein CXQ68_03160 [Ethanoligenens harbinense YUAN-3]AYF37989.1 hypothetical protein CXP51_03025 [Ethanoligenens harbinense]AYF40735.1 hypothetical protein CN246_03160 [Ethanoligenens harbinense]QCN91568.1 hypothetical protein DRA42_03165 [Ethanoligenens harbinense]